MEQARSILEQIACSPSAKPAALRAPGGGQEGGGGEAKAEEKQGGGLDSKEEEAEAAEAAEATGATGWVTPLHLACCMKGPASDTAFEHEERQMTLISILAAEEERRLPLHGNAMSTRGLMGIRAAACDCPAQSLHGTSECPSECPWLKRRDFDSEVLTRSIRPCPMLCSLSSPPSPPFNFLNPPRQVCGTVARRRSRS